MSKIAHIISSVDVSSGGPSKSVPDLCQQLSLYGTEISLITYKSERPYIPAIGSGKFKTIYLDKRNLTGLHSLKRSINQLIEGENFDIFHGHGLWELPVHFMSVIAQQKKVPYIITTRGMLEPWALNSGKWKKKMAMLLFQKRDLKEAVCIHATAKMEADQIRRLGFKNPIAVIPNGIDINEFSLKESLNDSRGKRRILFLSRIHPKKGIELLIEAWKKIDKETKQGWSIEIVGVGEEKYISSLRTLIYKYNLQEEINVFGPRYGSEKIKTYHEADIFVLPTYSENFGVVVAEALACGIPVITTKGTPWEELEDVQAGKWIDIGVEPLFKSLKYLMTLNDKERKIMGENGRRLIAEEYSINSVGKKMSQLYKWVLGEERKPKFVI